MFPINGSVTRCLPFLLTGSLGQVTPLSSGTMKALRLPECRRRGLRSSLARTYCVDGIVRVRRMCAARNRAPSASVPPGGGQPVHPRPVLLSQNTLDLPASQTAHRVDALLIDPGRILMPGLYGTSMLSPSSQTLRTPALRQFRGSITRLHARCVRFVPPSLTTTQHSLAMRWPTFHRFRSLTELGC